MQPVSNSLPVDFDGVFRFTNSSTEDFKAKWGGIEYTYPPMKTTPMVIPGATPEEVQSIRKKFAKEWAIKQFYGSEKFKNMNAHTPGGSPSLYTDSDLAPFIQKCLEPLPVAQATMTVLPKAETEKTLSRDQKGRTRTRVLEQGESLKAQAAVDIE